SCNHRSPFVVLSEKAELVGKIGNVHLFLPEHLHEIWLRYVDGPLHILGRIEANFSERQRHVVLIDPAECPHAYSLALEFSEIGQRSNALIIHLLGDAGHGIAKSGTIVAAIEDDHEWRALGHAIEQTSGRGHAGDIEFPGNHRGNGERAIHEFTMLDLNTEFLEKALLSRDIIAASGYERPIAYSHDVCGLCDAMGREAQERKSDTEDQTDFHCGLPAVAWKRTCALPILIFWTPS